MDIGGSIIRGFAFFEDGKRLRRFPLVMAVGLTRVSEISDSDVVVMGNVLCGWGR